MTELNNSEIEIVSGAGAFRTLGEWYGDLGKEMSSHPEALLMGPLFGTIYIISNHSK